MDSIPLFSVGMFQPSQKKPAKKIPLMQASLLINRASYEMITPTWM